MRTIISELIDIPEILGVVRLCWNASTSNKQAQFYSSLRLYGSWVMADQYGPLGDAGESKVVVCLSPPSSGFRNLTEDGHQIQASTDFTLWTKN